MVEYLGSGMPRILKAYSRDAYVFSSRFIRTVFPIDPTALDLEKEVAQTDTGAEKMSEKGVGKDFGGSAAQPGGDDF